jgi:hypothetical protein
METEAYEVSRAKALLRIIDMDISELDACLAQIEQMKRIPTVATDLRGRFRSLLLSKMTKGAA